MQRFSPKIFVSPGFSPTLELYYYWLQRWIWNNEDFSPRFRTNISLPFQTQKCFPQMKIWSFETRFFLKHKSLKETYQQTFRSDNVLWFNSITLFNFGPYVIFRMFRVWKYFALLCLRLYCVSVFTVQTVLSPLSIFTKITPKNVLLRSYVFVCIYDKLHTVF